VYTGIGALGARSVTGLDEDRLVSVTADGGTVELRVASDAHRFGMERVVTAVGSALLYVRA
jgi:hypothetical protein